jgi:hypothetical protein
MGVTCDTEKRKRKEKEKNENDIYEGEQIAKQKIVEIETKMRMLKDEILDLYKRLEQTNGVNIEEFEKEDIEKDLSDKIDEYKDLRVRRLNYKRNLKGIQTTIKDKEFDEDLDKFNKIQKGNKTDCQKIIENYENLKNQKKQTEIRGRKLTENENNLNDNKNVRENINNFFNKK